MKLKNNFEEIYYKFQNQLKEFKINYYNLQDKKYKLPLSDAIFCLEDKYRCKMFYNAIYFGINNHKKNIDKIVLVDAGSGTGILGLFGLSLGVKKCIFIEHNPYSLFINKKLIDIFNYNDKSEYILGDACKIGLKENYDILISETLESSLFNEDFPKIINNLKKYGNTNSIIIPEKLNIFIKEIDKNNNCINKHKIEIETKNGFKIMNVLLINKNINKINFKTNLILIDKININSGDSPFFLNEKTFNHKKNNHPFFNFHY